MRYLYRRARADGSTKDGYCVPTNADDFPPERSLLRPLRDRIPPTGDLKYGRHGGLLDPAETGSQIPQDAVLFRWEECASRFTVATWASGAGFDNLVWFHGTTTGTIRRRTTCAGHRHCGRASEFDQRHLHTGSWGAAIAA